MTSDIARANDMLARAGRATLATSVLFALLVAGMAAFLVVSAADDQQGRLLGLGCAALATFLLLSGWASYRQLSAFRFAEEGLQLRRAGQPLVLPWEAVQTISLSRRGMRIHASGAQPFAIGLTFAGDRAPLLALLAAHCPKAFTGQP